MRFFLLMAGFGLVAVTLETTWLEGIPTEAFRFDLVIVALAAISFSFGWRRALPVIVFYGAISDAAASSPFGMTIFSYLIVYGFIRAIIAKISFQGGLGGVFWVAIISLMDKLICMVVLMAATGEMAIPRIIIRRAPIQAILDAVVGLGLVPFLGWYWDLTWEKITRPKGLVMK